MKQDEYKDFILLLRKLEILFKCEYTQEKIDIFWNSLKQYKLFIIENAVNYLLRFRNIPYEVLPGEIEKAIIDYKEDERFIDSIKQK